MTRISILACAFASALFAQNVPLGQTLTQDGNSVILMPFSAPSIIPAPDPVPARGLMISIAPADVQATVIHVALTVQLVGGRIQKCSAQATVDKTHAFTTTGFSTPSRVAAVTAISVVIGTEITWGIPTPAQAFCVDLVAR